MATLTGANVAASNDATGNATSGGGSATDSHPTLKSQFGASVTLDNDVAGVAAF